MPKTMVGQVARLAGIGVETLRLYQREGMLDGCPILAAMESPCEADNQNR